VKSGEYTSLHADQDNHYIYISEADRTLIPCPMGKSEKRGNVESPERIAKPAT
jgi:hypothetical protein